jgi:hypothetical protein
MKTKTKINMGSAIYSIPGSRNDMAECACESKPNDVEDKFVSSVAELMCEVLNINWNERRIVKSLFINVINDTINDRNDDHPGLLQQYEAYILERASERLRSDMGVPKDIKINHNYATHAKYDALSKWIKNNWKGVTPEPVKEDFGAMPKEQIFKSPGVYAGESEISSSKPSGILSAGKSLQSKP